MKWLNELIRMHSDMESPRSFFLWSGLATISAVVKDNVWMDRGGKYNLYPNIYVMLYADSGMKKGTPVALAKNLVKAVNNTNIITGRASIQGILKRMGTGRTSPGGKVTTKSVAFYAASEFTSSLVADPAALDILTDLYDRHYNPDEWESLLKMEDFKLKDPCLSMLVATNEAHFEDFVANKDMKGGFIGRMFVIAESEVSHLNSLWKKSAVIFDKDKLVVYLKEVSTLAGEIGWENDEVGMYYDRWYQEFYTHVKKEKIKDPTGTINRFGDSILKIAMLLSMSDSLDKLIHMEHIVTAIEMGEKLIGSMRKSTTQMKGSTTNSQLKNIILNELYERRGSPITRQILMKKTYLHYRDAEEFDAVMTSFKEAGYCSIEPMGANTLYAITNGQLIEFDNYYKGKNK